MAERVYIDAEFAKDAICKCYITDDEKLMLIRRINRIPAADVVEVVRCGECKHYNDKLEMYSDYVCTIRHYCDGSPIIVGKDDFCSRGKRKDGGQDE